MRILLSLCPCLLLANPQTMLSQAEEVSKTYAQEIAKSPPPSPFPLVDNVLNTSSVWFTFDVNHLAMKNNECPLNLFSKDETWQILKEIGFDGVQIQGLRKPGSLGIDPKWGNEWPQVIDKAQKRGVALIGEIIGNATIAGNDFLEGLQNIGEYLNLYNLIEIDPKDWKNLPLVPVGGYETNIPWLALQELHRQGYVPENFTPYIKESNWNVTNKIAGVDGKVRRWIYLKEGKNNPVLAWMSPSFAAYRLAAGDALINTRELGQKILLLDGTIPPVAQEMLSLWIRKIGAYSAVTTNGTLDSMKNASTDLIFDVATRTALLHALLTQNAEALRMIYRLILESGIPLKRLIHVLQPFDQHACDWGELMNAPKKKFRYAQEQITGEILRQRLLKEDIYHLGSSERIPASTWVDYCARALQVKDFEKHRDEITNAHLLLAFTYAMQPGAFSISAADLVGSLPDQANHLELNANDNASLYASIPSQLKNPRSFTSKLKVILQARRESNIATGELIALPYSPNPGTLLLLHRLPSSRFIQLLAINFGRKAVQEALVIQEISQTTAIDLISHLAEEKVFSSASFSFTLPPLSGRAFYFQPKYYD